VGRRGEARIGILRLRPVATVGVRWQTQINIQKEIMPEVEIEIEQFKGLWYGECLIDWGDGEPQYRLISGDQESVVETCERIKKFVNSMPVA